MSRDMNDSLANPLDGSLPDVIDSKTLSAEISYCAIARGLVDKPVAGHACSKIVATQHVHNWNAFQVPEPWSGHLTDFSTMWLLSQ
jgi:hypothetical protein